MDMTASAAPVEAGSADDVALPANVSRNFRSTAYERAADDWYVEPRWCVEQLASAVDFAGNAIWDPCCGCGTILDTFSDRGHMVYGSDVVDRGAPLFFGAHDATAWGVPSWLPVGARISIVTNPPFKQAEQIARRAIAHADHRVCVLQQLSFLASKARHALFTEFPPSEILILCRRPSMPPGHMIADLGEKAFKGGTTDFCWIVWTKPHDRETRVRWLNPGAAA